MQALRQMGGGMIIAIISLLLVIGGISLALAETSAPPPPTPTPLPPTPPELFAPTSVVINTIESPIFTPTLLPSQTSLPTSCPAPTGWLQIVVGLNDTLYTLAERYKTTAEILSAVNCLDTLAPPPGSVVYVPPVPTVTVVPCGPPAGWVRTHIVQRGDNLFRIALSYGITYPQLQRANCMGTSTIIYAGQLLWVPNVPTRTPVPGVTIFPNTPTSTNTLFPSATTVPPTATSTFLVTASPTVTLTQTTVPPPTASLTPFPSPTPQTPVP
jgi:LysM repeat protein